MIINVYYDDPFDCDLIDISIRSDQNVEELQQLFFEWLFNEKNDHAYWIVENGVKKGAIMMQMLLYNGLISFAWATKLK